MDIKLDKLFDYDRWKNAIDHAESKGIDKALLIKLCEPSARIQLLDAITSGNYRIAPPHIAEIPKENGGMREVFVNEPIDRIFLSLYNDVMNELYGDQIHPACKSYQKGIGCGLVVKEVSRRIANMPKDVVAYKADLTKYFDSVNRETLDAVLRRFETGSALDEIIWCYYHDDNVFDVHGALTTRYGSLKQGCAYASFLANVTLWDIDDAISKLDVVYYRYSDDILVIGKDAERAMELLQEMLEPKGLRLNPKKIERLYPDKWFTFLGFNIKGEHISFSRKTVDNLQREIVSRTINADVTTKQAIHSVNSYLHRGYVVDGNRFGFGAYFLPVVNVTKDLVTLDNFIKDCIRAVDSGKKRLGGVGVNTCMSDCVVQRGRGRNVRTNRDKWREKHGSDIIDGYYTLSCMQNALRCGKTMYEILANISA